MSKKMNKNSLEYSNRIIFESLKELLPKSFKLEIEHVYSDKHLIDILLQLHTNINKILVNNPAKKALYLLCIARGLNNRVASSFVPEKFVNIRGSSNLQKIALAYCKTAMYVYNTNSLTLESFQVDDLNYWYNVIDTNLNIISSCNRGNIHHSEDTIYRNKFIEINSRVEALVKRNPKAEYFNLQSLLFTHLGLEKESRDIIVKSLKTGNNRVSLSNLTETYYRERLKKGKLPVVLYI